MISPTLWTFIRALERWLTLSSWWKKRKKLQLRIILDFVPNHSSDEHEWFKKSVQRVSGYEDYYVWQDPKPGTERDPPNNWVAAWYGSAWEWNDERKQFYLHQFHKKQPDLNYRNPAVVQAMKDVLRFWLDQGVDGFRIDAVPWLFETVGFPDEPVSGHSTDPLSQNYLPTFIRSINRKPLTWCINGGN